MLRIALITFAAFTLNILAATAQDMLFKLDGEQVEVKVLEITPSEVKYKLTSNPEGPTYVLPKKEVYMVEYANGSKEIFPKSGATETALASAVKSKKRLELEEQYAKRRNGGVAGVIVGGVALSATVPLLIGGVSGSGNQILLLTSIGTGIVGLTGLVIGINSFAEAKAVKARMNKAEAALLNIRPELMDATTYNGPLIRQGSGVGLRFSYQF